MWYGICFWKIVIGKYVFKVYYRCSKNKNKNDLYQRFWKCAGMGPFKLYWPDTYSRAFVNTRIGTTYASAFKSTGIGILNYIDLRPIPALFRTLE